MYKIIYNPISGNPILQNIDGTKSIPFDERNIDFVEFQSWNKKQNQPLDFESSIEVIPPPVKTAEVFALPVIAPDFIVQSPKPKTNHLQAHAEAIAEATKTDKSIALIVLDLVVYIQELEQRLKKAKI